MARDDWSRSIGDVTVRVARLGPVKGTSIPSLPPSVWRRASGIVGRLGVEEGLAALDARADRALERGHVELACRWRDLMAAIHAMSEGERFDGDTNH